MVAEWHSKYLQIPFVPRGRDWSGCDCWGLARLIQLEQFGRQMPCFSNEYLDDLDAEYLSALIIESKPFYNRIKEPVIGDLGVFGRAGQATHIATYIGDGYIIGSRKEAGVTVDEANEKPWSALLEGWYAPCPS